MFWKTVPIIFSFGGLYSCSHADESIDSTPQTSIVTTLPYYDSADFTPIWNPVNKEQLHTVAPFNFLNQNGNTVNDQTVNDKIYLVNFFFTSCSSICPKMMRNIEKVQNNFAENDAILFISHTVMPWADSVTVLKSYEKNFNVIQNKWHLVTGSKSEIYSLARKSYFVEEVPGFTKDSTEFLHTEHFVLIDKQKHLRGIYNGTVELEMERVIDDIEILLKEN